MIVFIFVFNFMAEVYALGDMQSSTKVNPKPLQVYQVMPSRFMVSQPSMPMSMGMNTMQQSRAKPEHSFDFGKLIQYYPEMREKLINIQNNEGIPKPWPEVLDLTSNKQHPMPPPEPIIDKLKELIKVIETLNGYISDDAHTLSVYIKRAKLYITEKRESLKRLYPMLKEVRARINAAKTPRERNAYILKFSKLDTEAQEQIESYLKLKAWVESITGAFASL